MILSMLCLVSLGWAQRYSSYQQYVTYSMGLGMNGYKYGLKDLGKNDFNGGLMARLGYHYVKRYCGVSAGLMLQSYNTNTVLNGCQEIPGLVDVDGNNYIHRTYFKGLEENQKQITMSIPLEFVYRVYLYGGMKLMLGVGPMFQFSMKNNYRITSGNVKTAIYYPDMDLLVGEDEDIPQYNIYTKTGFNGEYALRTVPGGIFEASILYTMEKCFYLNFGVYGTYSFAPQIKDQSANTYTPDIMFTDSHAEYNGVLNSTQVSKMNPFSFGIMVGLYYYLKSE